MRHLALALLLATACSDDEAPATGESIGLSERTVHDLQTKDFVSEGVTYTLVRVEYGDTPECSLADDEDCWYSTYCGFVVDQLDYPLEVYWVSDADALFDPALYCEDGELEGCELPGQTLPVLEDDDFEAWMYETDPDEDILVDCFADYW
jgi:hypothetical protein